jgi:ABC-type Fe3+-hydroxamate transport system substrate-binding protein
MNKAAFVLMIFLTGAIIAGCSKKTNPATTAANTPDTVTVKTVKRPPTLKTAVPKVIVVNDKVAKRSVDGRYYYDLEGHRYWRNNRDGKYYLFHKSMFDNPDFKSRSN